MSHIPPEWCQFTARRMERGSEVERGVLFAAVALHLTGHDELVIRDTVINALPNRDLRPIVRELATRLLGL